MENLFIDLYSYRQREARNPFEDWLTECLAAVLRSLTFAQQAQVFSRITGQAPDAIVAARTDREKTITVHTQVSIERDIDKGTMQRPDMLVRFNGEPWILFENKVSHSVDETHTADEPLEHQLHRYGAWLGKQRLSALGLQKTLVFLTHLTPVPVDFSDGSYVHPAYEGLGSRMTWSWGNISRLPLHETSGEGSQALSAALATAFYAYLKEYGIANEYPAHHDIVVAEMFWGKQALLLNLVNDMFRRLKGLAPFFEGNAKWARLYEDCAVYAADQPLAISHLIPPDSYLEAGLWFPELGDWNGGAVVRELFSNDITSSPKVYLAIGNDRENAFDLFQRSPEGWHSLPSEKLVFRDFSSFHGDPERRAQAIFAWVDEECAKLRAYFDE